MCLQLSALFLAQRRYSAHITWKNEYMKESPWLRGSYKLPVKADVSLQFGPKPANKTYKNKQIQQRNNQAKRKEDANISPVFFLVLNLQLLPEIPILMTVSLNRSEIITFKMLYLPKFSIIIDDTLSSVFPYNLKFTFFSLSHVHPCTKFCGLFY